MIGLTQKQRDILEFIDDFAERENIQPTIYEMADHFDIKTSTVFAHIKALERKNYISRSKKARSISILQPFKRLGKKKVGGVRHMSFILPIPLLGRINAGGLVDSQEYKEGEIYFDLKMFDNKEQNDFFALTVHGESMRDLGIYDGDAVLVYKTSEVKKNDIVVAFINNETTIKTYVPKDDTIELHPANNDFPIQKYKKDIVSVQGKVVALQRKF